MWSVFEPEISRCQIYIWTWKNSKSVEFVSVENIFFLCFACVANPRMIKTEFEIVKVSFAECLHFKRCLLHITWKLISFLFLLSIFSTVHVYIGQGARTQIVANLLTTLSERHQRPLYWGYYDAVDNVKYGLPMAFTVTELYHGCYFLQHVGATSIGEV